MPQLQYSKVNNAIITLTDTDDLTKGRHFKSRFIQPGLAGYPGQFGNALIKKENLDKFVWTLRSKPVTINHKDKIEDKDKVGIVNNVWFNPEDGWYWCDGIIFDNEAINLINNGWSVSCAYDFTKADNSGGKENNIPYDIEFLDGEFNHLALVDNPRYEGANIVFNSKNKVTNWLNNDEIGSWITTKDGAKIPIRKGLSKKDGIKEFANKHVEDQKRKNQKREEAYTILAGALGETKDYVKKHLKKSKKLQDKLEQLKTDDNLKTDVSFDAMEYYNLQGINEDDLKAQEELIDRALTDVLTDNFSIPQDEEAEYYRELEKKLNKGYSTILKGFKKDNDWEKAEQKLADLYGFDNIEDFRNEEKLTKFYQDLSKNLEDDTKAQNSLTDTILNAIAELIIGE
ncbi:MAG: DUF2213 domain-containing protein [Clostridiales bacterium]|nr:DUF2213 domain-containing protein [Clostridiales bacterium]